uniref:FBD domain-containing protein n=1 Tax=Ascaris lumbricoides TaxID=6252 RepID=A0A0M3I935_ASCLU
MSMKISDWVLYLEFLHLRRCLVWSGNLRAISLNVISEETNYDRIYEIAELMHSKKLMLHFGILQKDMKPERKEETPPMKRPPPAFGNILGRFEASFVTDDTLLRTLLLSNPLPKMSDAKFIQTSAVDNTVLFHLAMFAPRLRKLSLINCSEDKLDEGMVHFVAGFPSRISRCLQVIWKRKRNRPAAFFLQLVNDHAPLIKGYGARFFAKKFSANKDGERITVWDKKTKKALYIQDFDVNDAGRILGIVMPPDIEAGNRFLFVDL